MSELLEVKNLSVSFDTPDGEVQAVRDVSFHLASGEVLAIVGESGCGKSVLCKSIMKLLPRTARIKSGTIAVNGADITHYKEREMQKLRGKLFSMVFQDPMTSLDPTMTIGAQIAEAIRVHERKISKSALQQRVLALMELVGIERAAERARLYPYNFSGGMRQRSVMAIALASNPRILFADEPTTSLDVTIQAQILDLLRGLKDRINGSILLITHDLGVIAEMADYVVVMYAGKIIEKGTASEIFHHPMHPYTIGLQKSKPTMDSDTDELFNIPGNVPNPVNMPNYCYFRERCSKCVNKCKGDYPDMVQVSPTHWVACHLYEKENANEQK